MAASCPKHLFADFKGAKSRDASTNLAPVGTGAYKFVEFKPGDQIRGEINPDYHMPNRPYFDTIELKGGGDAVSAARGIIQTGEYDYAWNMQVEDEVLLRLEKGGKGRTIYAVGGDIEFIAVNFTDPNTEVDGERSSMKTKHPILSDPAVRKALALLVDRETDPESHLRPRRPHHRQLPQRAGEVRLQEHLVGIQRRKGGQAAGRGRMEGGRGRHPRERRQEAETALPDLDQRPAAEDPGDRQAGLQKAGIDVELKSVVASVFFSSDVANPDTYAKFYADIEMFQIPMTQPDPAQLMRRYHSRFVATKENKWQGTNFPRFVNADYDAAVDAAENEIDPVKRAALYIKCNDLLWQENAFIPVMHRIKVGASANTLRPVMSGWANDLDNLQDWYREA